MQTITDDLVAARVDVLRLAGLIDLALGDLGAGRAHQATKQLLPAAGGTGMFLTLAAVVPRFDLGIAKWASYVPGDGGRPSRSTTTIVASRASTGEPIALLSGMRATTLRTAAAAVAIARRWAPGAADVTLVGYGEVNRAVATALAAALPSLRRLHVVTRRGGAVAPGTRIGDVELVDHTDTRSALATTDLAVSATGSPATVASLADLSEHARILTLDGTATWAGADALPAGETLSDHDDPRVPSLAHAVAADDPRAAVRLVDFGGSAVADAALAHLVVDQP